MSDGKYCENMNSSATEKISSDLKTRVLIPLLQDIYPSYFIWVTLLDEFMAGVTSAARYAQPLEQMASHSFLEIGSGSSLFVPCLVLFIDCVRESPHTKASYYSWASVWYYFNKEIQIELQ